MPSSDHADLTRAWVQGMRSSDSESWTTPWQRVLWCRLTGQFAQLTANVATSSAERTLGWTTTHQAYFYVGRAHPDYERLVTVYQAPHDGSADWAVSPFDTGGMVKAGKPRIETDPATTTQERVELVREWTWRSTEYIPQMRGWIDGAYDEPAGYIRGDAPEHPVVAVIPATGNDSHAWTWEGRIPAIDYRTPPMRLVTFLATAADMKDFRRWVGQAGVLPATAIATWMRDLRMRTRETDSASSVVADMLA